MFEGSWFSMTLFLFNRPETEGRTGKGRVTRSPQGPGFCSLRGCGIRLNGGEHALRTMWSGCGRPEAFGKVCFRAMKARAVRKRRVCPLPCGKPPERPAEALENASCCSMRFGVSFSSWRNGGGDACPKEKRAGRLFACRLGHQKACRSRVCVPKRRSPPVAENVGTFLSALAARR